MVPCLSDTVDTNLNLHCNGNGTGNVNINLSNETSKATSDALTLRSVASTFPFVEPGPGPANNNLSLNGAFSTYDPSSLVEDKWKNSTGQTQLNGGPSSGNSGQNGQSNYNNGNLKRYNDNDHYLRYRTRAPALILIFIIYICRKSASVQIIAHEPSRCEGCFDGRLPLLLIVVFIALVLFLLCIGVILDAEGNTFYGRETKFIFG